ncbi:MAG TPA: J domain-containing protein [Rubrivivax sp.]|nr:J domain-containing protein [Rubrivivax sp.]
MADQARQAQEARPHKGRKPPRQTPAQKRAEEDAKRISQTVREVYRKLASALHPDRVDTDVPAAERASRTALMQRANAAYEAGDLLALLELQLQIEQVDLAHAANVAAEQVRHFNKVLVEQLRELEAEIDDRQLAFCASYGLLAERRLDPAKLGLVLKDEVRELAEAQAWLQRERRMMQGDPAQVKRRLKQWRAEQRALDPDDPFF